MPLVQTNISTVTGLNVLKALKNILGSGWTLDESDSVLWKSSPSAFPIGFSASDTTLVPAVKVGGSIIKPTMSSPAGGVISDSTTQLTVYTAPNGSVGIAIDAPQSGVVAPSIFILRNGNTNSAMPQDVGFSGGKNSTSRELISPMTASKISTSSVFHCNVAYNANSITLTQLADPFTGTALKDLYTLVSSTGSSGSLPLVVSNGSAKYIRVNFSGSSSVYFRYT